MERLQVLVSLKRRNRAVSLSVPLYVLYLAVAVAVGFVVFSGILARVALQQRVDAGRLIRLAGENRRLRSQLIAATAAIDTFRNYLAATEQMDNRVRAAMNLELIPSDIRLMGIGGPAPATPLPQADELVRRVAFNEQSLAEIDRALSRQQDKLRCLPSIWPVQGHVMSVFGFRTDPFTGGREFHQGLDIAAPAGTPIVAPADGEVVSAGWQSGLGRCVEVDHGHGIRTVYGHCRTLKVNDGQLVRRGQVIATVGATGRATGTHLHYGVKVNGSWVNPRNYIISR